MFLGLFLETLIMNINLYLTQIKAMDNSKTADNTKLMNLHNNNIDFTTLEDGMRNTIEWFITTMIHVENNYIYNYTIYREHELKNK